MTGGNQEKNFSDRLPGKRKNNAVSEAVKPFADPGSTSGPSVLASTLAGLAKGGIYPAVGGGTG